MLLLMTVSLLVGISIGAVGIGGILLIPALVVLAGLGVHEAMATALLTFFFTGIVGALLFQRRGSIRWQITVPVSIGAVLFGFVGAWANSRLNAPALTLILSSIIVFAGIYTLRMHARERVPPFDSHPGRQRALLTGIGAVVGFGSGLTGVGGPAVSVPIMVMFGFAPLATIGASQVIQIVAALSGTAGNLRYGSIDYGLAVPVALAQIIGVPLGVRIVHAVNAATLRRFIGMLCIVVGTWLAVRVLL